jgi:hypothetical protein
VCEVRAILPKDCAVGAHENKSVMSTTPPALVEIILQRVANRTGRRVRNLAVEVGAERVVLRGLTDSFHVKQLAQTGAREALPGAILENAIEVA